MANIYITTTGLTPSIILSDLGYRVFTHPVNHYNIGSEFTYDELISSMDFNNSLDFGYLTASYNGKIITTSNEIQPVNKSTLQGTMILATYSVVEEEASTTSKKPVNRLVLTYSVPTTASYFVQVSAEIRTSTTGRYGGVDVNVDDQEAFIFSVYSKYYTMYSGDIIVNKTSGSNLVVSVDYHRRSSSSATIFIRRLRVKIFRIL